MTNIAAGLSMALDHVRQITKRSVEIRDVTISEMGLTLTLDSPRGEPKQDIVCLNLEWDTMLVTASNGSCGFVGQWLIQGNITLDHAAAWFAIMANRTGHGHYWMETLEVSDCYGDTA